MKCTTKREYSLISDEEKFGDLREKVEAQRLEKLAEDLEKLEYPCSMEMDSDGGYNGRIYKVVKHKTWVQGTLNSGKKCNLITVGFIENNRIKVWGEEEPELNKFLGEYQPQKMKGGERK